MWDKPRQTVHSHGSWRAIDTRAFTVLFSTRVKDLIIRDTLEVASEEIDDITREFHLRRIRNCSALEQFSQSLVVLLQRGKTLGIRVFFRIADCCYFRIGRLRLKRFPQFTCEGKSTALGFVCKPAIFFFLKVSSLILNFMPDWFYKFGRRYRILSLPFCQNPVSSSVGGKI